MELVAFRSFIREFGIHDNQLNKEVLEDVSKGADKVVDSIESPQVHTSHRGSPSIQHCHPGRYS